jgi:hypothetical protein
MDSRFRPARGRLPGLDRSHLLPAADRGCARDIVVYFARHHVGLETESIADGLGETLLVVFAAGFHRRIGTTSFLTALVAAAIIAACTLVIIGACLQGVAWISFVAPPGIFAAGALPDVLAFGALLAWLVAISLSMLRDPMGAGSL